MSRPKPPETPALLIEVTSKEYIKYSAPKWVSDLLCEMADQHPFIYGRRPKFTIARGLDLIEQVLPGTKAQVTITRTDRPDKALDGVKPDRMFYDEIGSPIFPHETHD
jgi:hypothetical protein